MRSARVGCIHHAGDLCPSRLGQANHRAYCPGRPPCCSLQPCSAQIYMTSLMHPALELKSGCSCQALLSAGLVPLPNPNLWALSAHVLLQAATMCQTYHVRSSLPAPAHSLHMRLPCCRLFLSAIPSMQSWGRGCGPQALSCLLSLSSMHTLRFLQAPPAQPAPLQVLRQGRPCLGWHSPGSPAGSSQGSSDQASCAGWPGRHASGCWLLASA